MSEIMWATAPGQGQTLRQGLSPWVSGRSPSLSAFLPPSVNLPCWGSGSPVRLFPYFCNYCLNTEQVPVFHSAYSESEQEEVKLLLHQQKLTLQVMPLTFSPCSAYKILLPKYLLKQLGSNGTTPVPKDLFWEYQSFVNIMLYFCCYIFPCSSITQ